MHLYQYAAASLLSKKKIELINLPQVKDIKTMLTLLESLGSKVKKSWKKNDYRQH